MTRTKHWRHLLDRLGKGMALTGTAGIVALAASLTATTVLAWQASDYTITTSTLTSVTAGSAGAASQQATPGQFIYDTATLTSSFEYVQSGTLEFFLYPGSAPQSCHNFNYSGLGSLASYTVPVTDTDTGESRGPLTESLSSLGTTVPNTGFQVPTNAANGTNYYWVAVYTDGQETLQQESGCNSEPVTVKMQLPTLGITTQANPSSASVGTSVGDSAFVSNYATLLADDSRASGSVTFFLYQGTSCTGTPVYASRAEALSGTGTAATPTNAYTATAAGPYEWAAEATVNVGSNWPSIQPFWTNCGSEPLSVKSADGLTTAISAVPALIRGSVQYGASVSDTATVFNDYHPTGTVVFNLYDNASCSGAPVYSSGGVALVSGQASSGAYIVNQAGTWEWTATYSGDTYNSGATSPCGSEPLTVCKAAPAITTVTSSGTTEVPVGSRIADTANVTNSTNGTLNSASGTVDFHLYQQNNQWVASCQSGLVFSDLSDPLTVGQPYSTATSSSYQVLSVGHYDWTATYSGDSNDSKNDSQCGSEAVDVVKSTPAITTLNNNHAVEGSSITDEAEITGGYNADNSQVTFSLYSNDIGGHCSGLVGTSSTRSINSSGDAFSAPVRVLSPGEYYWVDNYLGNADNQSVSSSCGAEVVWVTNYCPTIATVQDPSIVTSANTTVSDTAILSNFYPNPNPGGYNGGVAFQLFGPVAASDPNACQWGTGGDMALSSWAQLYDVSGQYEATLTADLHQALLPGDYFWEAEYSEPGYNFDNNVTAGCGELTVITQNTASVATSPSSGGAIGATLTDTATVTWAVEAASDPATDSVSFELVSSCPSTVGAAPATNTVVSDFGAITTTSTFDTATGTYTYNAAVPSSGYKSTAAGTYYWNVSFSGDAYNVPVTNQCGEPVAVTSTPGGGVLAASTTTPITGADLFGPGLAGALAMLFGGLLLILGRRVFRTRAD
ncbi:MAG: hypothetical protein ACRENX_00565 [Candidatus Dormibacteria bacterium]